jgi:hypothetical protein
MAKRTRTRGQTIQWPKEKGQEDKQYNGQKNKDKRTNIDIQSITQKTKNRATRTMLKKSG